MSIQAAFPCATVWRDDFLSLTPERLGAFDRIVMNPPFTHGADVKHILHARQFLNRNRRIGHAVLKVRDFRRSEEWYKTRFGFLTSDEIEAAEGLALGALMRCDRGDRPADHHTLFLAQLPGPLGLLHAAFEVANIDDLMLGHQHLKAKKRKAAWGVGRHILGSQVFDYWKDPFGNELEHWTDGDLFTAADPPQKMPMSALLAVQWGSPNPMFAGKMPPPQGLVSFFMALNLRLRRLFRRNPKESAA